MNFDQRANLKIESEAIVARFAGAWRNYRVLIGLHEGGKSFPDAAEKFPELIDELWRCTFEALHLSIGSLIDRSAGTHSIKAFIKLIRKYHSGDAVLSQLCRDVEREIESNSVTGIAKSEFWRNKAIAHNTRDGRDAGLYEQNKTTLAEVEVALQHLQKNFGRLTFAVDNTINLIQEQALGLQSQSFELMRRLSRDV
jgi:hypothetical protein